MSPLTKSLQKIDITNHLSYRQIQIELKKRKLGASGKKNDIVKRLKVAYEKEQQNQTSDLTHFQDLANEIYLDIFDYLTPLNIVQSFFGLNYRLNCIISSIPMRVNFDPLSKTEHKRVLKQILPTIINQTIGLQLGKSSSVTRCFSPSIDAEFLIDLFTQSFQFTQFSHLRFLSLSSPSSKQLECLLIIIPQLSSLRSLRLLEQNYYSSDNETVCKLTLATARHSPIRHDVSHLTHLSIETSPPFRNLTQLIEQLVHKISLDYLHLHIRSAFFAYPDSMLRLDYNTLSSLVPDMTYLKTDIVFGTFQPAFDLIRRFPHVHHLSIKTISQAYADGDQWAELLAQMRNLTAIDLDISLDSYACNNDELKTFQTKFWSEKRWMVYSSACKIKYRSPRIR